MSFSLFLILLYFSFQQENAPDMVYLGSLTNFDLIYAWTQDKCVPLVREITFENGEVRLFLLFYIWGFFLETKISLSRSLFRIKELCVFWFRQKMAVR